MTFCSSFEDLGDALWDSTSCIIDGYGVDAWFDDFDHEINQRIEQNTKLKTKKI